MRGAGEFLEDMSLQQHQSMLSRMASMNNGGADALAGGLMSRGRAVGGPMISGAMGMLGLDPMSLGLRAGMGAWSSGAGVLGAGMAGMGAAAGVGILGAGAAFVGNQMYSGAQQQLHLNQGLRSNFNFINPQGGTGFTAQQGYSIGSHLRSMTHDLGASGEVATFGELSRLATNMGRMGFAQNTRSVQEFKDKFKEMITTLKQVATDMGSSLEEAQKFVQSMKGSGIFRTADQLKMSQGTRIAAAAGGVAMSEVTGMANIGSQISRSVGGLGRQGAFAGIKTIEQIGLAQKVGAISEEDVYNATGLTGAEGRQAMATAQLQQSARFLSSGRGRRFLASVAGKDGRLDEGSVMEWLSGGNTTTDRTMEMAHHNLEGVGRANFIRNEGRLRGAALEKFGGMLQAGVYKQWLSSRGYDPTSMDDKAMLAFQRFSGLGRDEADAQIKMIQRIPEMMQERRNAIDEQRYSDEYSKYNKSVGIEGFRRKFDQARENIQGKMQQAGADVMAGLEQSIAGWFNKVMGVYERRGVEGVDRLQRMVNAGDPAAKSEIQRMFRGSSSLISGDKIKGLDALSDVGGGGLSSAVRIGSLQSSLEGVSASGVDKAFMTGGRRDAFRTAFAEEAAGLRGRARADKIMDIVGRDKTAAAQKYVEEYSRADEAGKLALAERMTQAGGFEGAGIAQTLDAQSLNINDAGTSSWQRWLGIGKAGATKGDITEATGGALITREKGSVHQGKNDYKGLAMSVLFGALGNTVSGATDYFTDKADAKEAGEFMRSQKGQRMIAGIMDGKGSDFEAAQNRIAALKSKGEEHLSRGDSAELQVLQNAQTTRALGVALKGKSVETLTAAEKKKVEEDASRIIGRKVSFDEVLRGAAGIKSALDIVGADQKAEILNRTASDIKGLKGDLVATGVMDESGKIIAGKGDTASGKLAVELANMNVTDGASYEAYRAKRAELAGMIGDTESIEEKRKFARMYAGSELGEMWGASAARKDRLQSRIKSFREGPGRAEGAIGALLGVDVDKDMRKAMAEGSTDKVAAMYAAGLGVSSSTTGASDFKAALAESVKLAREGKIGAAADKLSSAEAGASDEVKKELQAARDAKLGPLEKSEKHLKSIADDMKAAVKQLQLIPKDKDKENAEYGDGNGGAGPPRPPQPGGR